jgi:HAD superfamily hydrolase (TIGR01484 family)
MARAIEPLRLIVFDIDGVLTDGEAQPWDLGLMAELAELNRAARLDSSRPAVTLCSGRPAPYVDAMLQAIDGHLPAVFESGAGLYDPAGYRFIPNPSLGTGSVLRQAKQRLIQKLVRPGHAAIQPGKEYSMSLFPTDPAALAALEPLAREALGSLGLAVDLVYSASCLNVMPAGIDKAGGLYLLAKVTGIPLAAMLAVGDSAVDGPMLTVAGASAAPANASPYIQRIARYVAPSPTAQGVREILAHFGVA